MNITRHTIVLVFALSLFVAGGIGAGCGKSSDSKSDQNSSSETDSDPAGVEDAVEYGTGERSIEQGEQLKDSLDETEQKKKQQLDQVQNQEE